MFNILKHAYVQFSFYYESIFASAASSAAMPQFRWLTVGHDITLACEVTAFHPSKPSDWEAIAATLSSTFYTDERLGELKGRGCRERLNRLVEKFRADDTRSLKDKSIVFERSQYTACLHEFGSGTEEDYDELNQLLQDIFEYQ